MEKIGIFPGSFDPFTAGHEEIVQKALGLFDRVIVAVGGNLLKSGFFPVEKRVEMIRKVFRDEPRVEVEPYDGLTVDFCRTKGARHIIRGLRSSADYRLERDMASCNFDLADIDTVMFNSSPGLSHVSSTLVRDIILHDPARGAAYAPAGVDYRDYL